jgi:hypothetical protein
MEPFRCPLRVASLELEPKGIRVGTVTIFGFVRAGTAFSPDHIAEEFLAMSREAPGAPNERQFRG